MSARAANLLLSGYYGFGNFGDEAILRVFVREWNRRRPLDRISVLSADPSETAMTHGVNGLPRMPWSEVRTAVALSDVVVSGGGGLLQNASSTRSLLYYAGLIHEAARAKRTATVFAQGIGPLNFVGRQIVKRACSHLSFASVRDESSAELLRSLLPHATVRVTADPVFLAPATPAPQSFAPLEREGLKDLRDPLVIVALRRCDIAGKMLDRIAAAVDRFARQHGAQVAFVPLQPPGDSEASIQVIRRCRSAPVLLRGGYDLDVMSALLGRCSAIVAMRLHALILAARLGVPFIAIPYDPKVAALTSGLAYPLPDMEARSDAFSLVDDLWARRAELARHLKAASAEMERRARLAFDWLEQTVEGTVT